MQRENDLIIVGRLGHMGLPLGIVFASKGLRICLDEITKDVAEKVQKGRLPYVEYAAELQLKETLTSGNLTVSLDSQCDGAPHLAAGCGGYDHCERRRFGNA